LAVKVNQDIHERVHNEVPLKLLLSKKRNNQESRLSKSCDQAITDFLIPVASVLKYSIEVTSPR